MEWGDVVCELGRKLWGNLLESLMNLLTAYPISPLRLIS